MTIYCSVVVLLFILIYMYLCTLHSLLSVMMFLKDFITDKNNIGIIVHSLNHMQSI